MVGAHFQRSGLVKLSNSFTFGQSFVDNNFMERSYRLIGMLLEYISDFTDDSTFIAADKYTGTLARFRKSEVGQPVSAGTLRFDDFDIDAVFDHYLIMHHDGLVFAHKLNPIDPESKDFAIRLTAKGYNLLDEYKKWTT